MQETEIFRTTDNNIYVSNLRAIFFGTTYSVSNVSSLKMNVASSNYACIYFILTFIFLAIVCPLFYSNYIAPAIVFTALLALFLYLGLSAKTNYKYTVVLTTNAGEQRAFETYNKDLAEKVLTALNTAIVSR